MRRVTGRVKNKHVKGLAGLFRQPRTLERVLRYGECTVTTCSHGSHREGMGGILVEKKGNWTRFERRGKLKEVTKKTQKPGHISLALPLFVGVIRGTRLAGRVPCLKQHE